MATKAQIGRLHPSRAGPDSAILDGDHLAPVNQLILTEALAANARWRASKTALVCAGQRLTYAEFNSRVNRAANYLIHQGVRRGDKVSLLLPNSIEMAVAIFAILKAGGVVVPLSTMLPEDALQRMVADSDSVLFVREPLPETGDDREPAVPLTYEDDFNIIYSSGTTGAPKGIVHTHYARSQYAAIRAMEYRITPQSVSIVATPMYSNGTMAMLLPTLMLGGTVAILPRFTPQAFLELVEKEKGTHSFLVPTQFSAILAAPEFDRYNLSSLSNLNSTGAHMKPEMKLEILRRFRCGFAELYGLTEGIATVLRPEDVPRKPESVGTPILGADIKILDEQGREVPRGEAGEIAGWATTLMRGYYKQPEKTAEVFWRDSTGRAYLKTGDIGRLDADGFLYLLDRKKDMIISGGINVYSCDVEAVFLRHPRVRDVAVIGVPHDKWGETPLAIVVANGSLTEDELKDWVNRQLAAYQRVQRVEFRAELPRNPLGKVVKTELRKPYWS